MIHPTAQVDTQKIGPNTRVWQHAIILSGARIGDHCNINCHTFIENEVVLGNHVTVKSGVYLWDGIRVADNVFIGPNATFVNDRYPRSKAHLAKYPATILEQGCSIGAGAVILDGLRIGAYALIAAGSVVTRDVPSHALVKGNPARIAGWVDEEGHRLVFNEGGWMSNTGRIYPDIPPPSNA